MPWTKAFIVLFAPRRALVYAKPATEFSPLLIGQLDSFRGAGDAVPDGLAGPFDRPYGWAASIQAPSSLLMWRARAGTSFFSSSK